MSINSIKKQAVSLDMLGYSKLKNLPSATVPGEAVELSQLNTELAQKQNNMVGAAGITVDGTSIAVDLATAGDDHSAFNVTEAAYPSIEGQYTRLPYQAYLDYAGTDLDLNFGGDFNCYYKDNGGGVWSFIARREIDGNAGTYDGEGWMAVLVSVDPTTVVATVNSMVPNYQAVDYDMVAYASVVADNSYRSPAAGGYGLNSETHYSSGSTPAGLIFDNSKLAVDFAETVGAAASTKLFPSSVIKAYVDERNTDAKVLANHPFSNNIAGITGNPANAQSAFEGLAAENDVHDGQISSLQVTDAVHDARIASNAAAVGISVGDSTMGAFTAPYNVHLHGTGSIDPATAKDALNNLAYAIQQAYVTVGQISGVPAGDTNYGTGFTLLPNNASTLTHLQTIEGELQQLAIGQGTFWNPVEAYSSAPVDVTNPDTNEFGGASVTSGQRVLLTGQVDPSENGIYEWAASNSAMVRADDADSDAQFTTNRTVQVLASAEGGISGATFAYTGDDSPAVETDDLVFILKAKGVVGDNSITPNKVEPTFLTEIRVKTDKWVGDVTTDASGNATFAHGVGDKDFVVSVKDSTDEVVNAGIEIVHGVSDVTIRGEASTTYRVVVIG